jgi:hypothetical protein
LGSFRKKSSKLGPGVFACYTPYVFACYTPYMASPRQIEANQRNGKLSRGPKTGAGKAASAKNALQHGLLSSDAVLFSESAEDYAEFTENLCVELKPVGELEGALVGRIGGLFWRLKRIGKLEAGILEWRDARESSLGSLGLDLSLKGEAYTRAADVLVKLSRYETSIERSLYKALHELQRLQAARNGEPVPAPVVVDVNVSEH